MIGSYHSGAAEEIGADAGSARAGDISNGSADAKASATPDSRGTASLNPDARPGQDAQADSSGHAPGPDEGFDDSGPADPWYLVFSSTFEVDKLAPWEAADHERLQKVSDILAYAGSRSLQVAAPHAEETWAGFTESIDDASGVRVDLWTNLSQLVTAPDRSFDLIHLHGNGDNVILVWLRISNFDSALRVQLRHEITGGYASSSWSPLPDGWFKVSLLWQRESYRGAADGRVSLEINDVSAYSATTAKNFDVDPLRRLEVGFAYQPNRVTGEVYIDDLRLWRLP